MDFTDPCKVPARPVTTTGMSALTLPLNPPDGRAMASPLEARFRQLWDQHGPALGRVARSYTRTRAEQEDLLQEISLGLWRALPGFRGECSERTFAFRIAHNLGLNHAMRRKPGEPEVEVPDPRPDPETRAGDAQRRERLLGAIRGLPLPYRQVITLALEEMSHQEIADILGLTANNTAVRLSRAREMLRAALMEKP